MKDVVIDSYEVALEVLKQRKSSYVRALEEFGRQAGEIDPAEFNRRIVRPRECPHPGEEQ